MTVIKCTICTKTFVTARTHEEHDEVYCPFCGESGFMKMNTDPRFYNEGLI